MSSLKFKKHRNLETGITKNHFELYLIEIIINAYKNSQVQIPLDTQLLNILSKINI